MTDAHNERVAPLGLALGWAAQADGWLKRRGGRVYATVLASGLGLSIAATLRNITAALQSPRDLTLLALTVAFETLLLVNQLAQLHEVRLDARQRRAARRAALR